MQPDPAADVLQGREGGEEDVVGVVDRLAHGAVLGLAEALLPGRRDHGAHGPLPRDLRGGLLRRRAGLLGGEGEPAREDEEGRHDGDEAQEPLEHAAVAYGRVDARETLVDELRTHALVLGRVVLTSGREADYYVDAKRAILRPRGFLALGELVAALAREHGATAVGGMTMGADPVACAALAGGFDGPAFFVRKETKAHGLQRRVEGPPLGPEDRCLVVEDVVTTGGSTVQAIEALDEAGLQVCGVVSVLDRLAGGEEAIVAAAHGAPYVALTTIDDIHPDR